MCISPSLQARESHLLTSLMGLGVNQTTPEKQTKNPPGMQVFWGNEAIPQGTYCYPFHYILNPDGTLRWLIPIQNRYPIHLSLYNSAHVKCRLYKMSTHLAYQLGLARTLFSGSLRLICSEKPPLLKLINQTRHDGYAIFTGTVGKNRKGVVALARERRVSHFLKIAHTPAARQNLAREANCLAQLGHRAFSHLVVPRMPIAPQPGMLMQTNVCPPLGRESAYLELLHLKGLGDSYRAFHQCQALQALPYYQDIKHHLSQIQELEAHDPSLEPQQIHRIKSLLQKNWEQAQSMHWVQVSLAHGDFTPWNLYLSKRQIHVYDWELSRPKMPLLYDFFHFIYQSGILLTRQSFRQIHREIFRGLRLPGAKKLLGRYDLDATRYHQLYLVYVVSFYLLLYLPETQVHPQVKWLLNTWETALQWAADPKHSLPQ